MGSLLSQIVNLGFRRFLEKPSNAFYVRRLLEKSSKPKIFNLIRVFVSLYKVNLHILSFSLEWLQQKCNVYDLKTLQPL